MVKPEHRKRKLDIMSEAGRSENMRRIKARDTGPERLVRSVVHRMGYRFRLHRKDLPGNPDLVFPSRRKIIFVHGCFWHRHARCRRSNMPRSNTEYWAAKLARNKARDIRSRRALRRAGWDVFVIWECQLRDLQSITGKLKGFLDS